MGFCVVTVCSDVAETDHNPEGHDLKNPTLIFGYEKQISNIKEGLFSSSLLVYNKQDSSLSNKTNFTFRKPETRISDHKTVQKSSTNSRNINL
jgi:hypothetical protein